jgi:hypothetical protein
MAFKQKGWSGFQMKSPMKQYAPYAPTEEEITNEPRKYKFAGKSEWEKDATTGDIRRVKQELTEEELGQKGLMEQEISALGEEPNVFMDPEANDAYWVKHNAITSKYGQ